MTATVTTPYQRKRAEREQARAQQATPEPQPKAHRTEEQKRERAAEINRRNMESRRRALFVLAERYPDEYAALLATERAGVNAERGPLPGDS